MPGSSVLRSWLKIMHYFLEKICFEEIDVFKKLMFLRN